jgi:hypothetical protein
MEQRVQQQLKYFKTVFLQLNHLNTSAPGCVLLPQRISKNGRYAGCWDI